MHIFPCSESDSLHFIMWNPVRGLLVRGVQSKWIIWHFYSFDPFLWFYVTIMCWIINAAKYMKSSDAKASKCHLSKKKKNETMLSSESSQCVVCHNQMLFVGSLAKSHVEPLNTCFLLTSQCQQTVLCHQHHQSEDTNPIMWQTGQGPSYQFVFIRFANFVSLHRFILYFSLQ